MGNGLPKDGVEVLVKALEVWGPNGEHWVRGFWSNGVDKHCLLGGLDKAAHGVLRGGLVKENPYKEAIDLVQSEVPEQSLFDFNDAKERKFAEVKEVVCRAIERGKNKGVSNGDSK